MSVCYDGGVSWMRMGCAETVLDVYCNYSRMDMNFILYVVPRCVCVLFSSLLSLYMSFAVGIFYMGIEEVWMYVL